MSFSVVANPFGEQMAGMQMDKYFSQLLTEKFLRDKMMASEATFDSTHTDVRIHMIYAYNYECPISYIMLSSDQQTIAARRMFGKIRKQHIILSLRAVPEHTQ